MRKNVIMRMRGSRKPKAYEAHAVRNRGAMTNSVPPTMMTASIPHHTTSGEVG